MKVLLRADASQVLGSGHVMRCLALAAALRARGAHCSFACRELPAALREMINAQGHDVLLLADAGEASASLPLDAGTDAWQADIAALAQALPGAATLDWIIVDHYALDARWQTAARAFARRIAAIDDLADRAHAVDLLLDQNLTASAQRYAPWLTAPCTTLFGPGYALLRGEFQRAPIAVREQVTRVLVNFGGMDAAGQTLKAVQALTAWPALRVDVVAGQGNPHWPALQALVAAHRGWTLQAHSGAFAELMASADLFIGAGGSTSWERAALGLPTLCLAVADNQQANAQALAAAGAHAYLGACETVTQGQLAQAIGALLDNPALRADYARRSRQLVDGQGAARVAAALLAWPDDGGP